MKKKLLKATVQLIIGLILLLIVGIYSSKVPDRQKTFFNQFNVLIVQVKILYYKLIGKGDIAHNKFNDIMALKSLIQIGKQSKCLTGVVLKKVEDLLRNIEELSLDEYSQKRAIIISDYINIQDYLRQKCPNIKFYKP